MNTGLWSDRGGTCGFVPFVQKFGPWAGPPRFQKTRCLELTTDRVKLEVPPKLPPRRLHPGAGPLSPRPFDGGAALGIFAG